MKFSGEVHPAAELLPLMPEADLAALAADIAAQELQEPLLLDPEGRLVDGRNRLRACEMANVKPRFTEIDGDPLAIVISRNVRRRDLSRSQRAIAAAEAWDSVVPESGTGQKRRELLASMFNVPRTYVQEARALTMHDPEAAVRVLNGDASLKDEYAALRKRQHAAEDARKEVLRSIFEATRYLARRQPKEATESVAELAEQGLDLTPEDVRRAVSFLTALSRGMDSSDDLSPRAGGAGKPPERGANARDKAGQTAESGRA